MKAIKSNTTFGYTKAIKLMFLFLIINITTSLKAQTLYIDVLKGKAGAEGTIDHPLASLEEAINKTNNFSGLEPVCLKVAPGAYLLTHELSIRTARQTMDTVAYTIEAMIMPDQYNWEQFKMPLILSLSSNSQVETARYAIGFLVQKHNVNFKGLKFIGNSNSNVTAYYPIKRADTKLSDLNISQCYFIGKKENTPIEGALWLSGSGIHIDHCIFSGNKTAIILSGTVNNFSLTHSIITGSYESAIWSTGFGTPFTFKNNVITNCKYVMVHPENKQPGYIFSNSCFILNDNYLGAYAPAKNKQVPIAVPVNNNNIKEINIRKTGKIKLAETNADGIPHDYLNLSKDSDGRNTSAGILMVSSPD
ncbi:hypothetical protein [Pedobacter sp. UYP1]|jgi:hypothetical protein|uniref:right-handed parallel beta-helix repeat-containing protein n=1 Tax=Pedobacter sp. UYP1 TaxID=1756396 RepID=UPI0033980D69